MSEAFNPLPWQPKVITRMCSQDRMSAWVGLGMGKSVSTLTALDSIATWGDNPYPVLVIAPKKVAQFVWPFEAKKWKHLEHIKIMPILGTLENRVSALMYKADIYVINYENVVWLIKYLGTKWPFKTVVCDESIKLKSFRIRQGGSRASALGQRAMYTKRWYNLTGEPCPNGMQDLWGPQWFIDGGQALGKSYESYISKYFSTGYNGYDTELKEGSFDTISGLLLPTSLTIRAEDYMALDKPVIHKRRVKLAPEVLKNYKQLERELFMDIKEGVLTVNNAAEKTMKCLQFANGTVYTESSKWEDIHDDKLIELDTIIAEAGGEPIVVCYHFKHDLARLKARYPEGKELRTKRDEDAWNEGRIRLLFIHPMSAGHGLNLQWGGRRMVFFAHWWALDPHLQVIERLGPMRQFQAGFKRLVHLYYIIAEGTMDDLVMQRHAGKKEIQDLLKERMALEGF